STRAHLSYEQGPARTAEAARAAQARGRRHSEGARLREAGDEGAELHQRPVVGAEGARGRSEQPDRDPDPRHGVVPSAPDRAGSQGRRSNREIAPASGGADSSYVRQSRGTAAAATRRLMRWSVLVLVLAACGSKKHAHDDAAGAGSGAGSG